CQQHNTYPRTF
nr:immunoglobulin light chain junction region [Macaca mulatta]MOV37291.1 immunoglobulin light chain junction region [Macaca mulatta]MOV60919.1 immunoglobulin light chain junction region [Macaca mulatta]MOV60940.1 immunoglobulin light chain junction region [Macaca mulatta]MOV60944.1 immunoglobulin light chain junction region [Macaca mulatta]